MSIEAISWAWQQDAGLPSMKLVLLAIADHADKQGNCWPSFERISDMTGLSQPTIWRAMNHLTGIGLVQQIPQGRGYRFSLSLPNTIQSECNRSADTIQIETDTIQIETDIIQSECLTVKNHKEPPSGKRAAPKAPLPEDWTPDAKLLSWAQERAPHVDTALETEKFLDHFCHIKPDRRSCEGWRASWRTWILRARRDYTPAANRFASRSERTTQRNASLVRDALADRSASEDSLRDLPGLSFRLIEGGRAGAD